MSIPEIIAYLDGLVWGLPAIITLVCAGIVVAIFGGFYQIRKFPLAFKTFIRYKGERGKGEVSPFKIWAAVTGATVGIGNIAGASTAIHLGGAGALFWMWICAIFGMGLKGVEVVLALWSRKVLPDGRVEGGTPYYIRLLPGIGPALALFFAICLILNCYGSNNFVQANNVALGVEYVVKEFFGEDPGIIFQARLIVGIIMAVLVALVVLGGVRRIAEFANYIVPFMATWYIVFGLGVLVAYAKYIPLALSEVFTYAFTPQAAAGGLAGWTVFHAIRWGFARGLFSNEAGAGSAPNGYAYMTVDHPGRAAMYGIMEVFLDTIVICSITCLTVLTSRVYIEEPELTAAPLVMEAFKRVYGSWAPLILGISLTLFALTTMLTWEWYGEVNWRYFFVRTLKLPEKPMIWLWRILWVIPIIPCAVTPELFKFYWDFADLCYGLEAIPNLVAVIYLSPVALKLIKDFYSRHVYETGEVAK